MLAKRRMGSLGFTLVELAIVLIIIGIIVGAVLKGQDLIQNARTKKFISKVRSWEVAQWTFYDREGRFAGDSDRDGKIGDGSVKTDLTGANFINPPYEGSSGSETNTITMGSYTFYVFFGTDNGQDTGKNVMIICNSNDCSTSFSSEQLTYIKALDTAFDGNANGADGQLIGAGASDTITASTTTWVAYASSVNATDFSTSTKAIIYYFDAKR